MNTLTIQNTESEMLIRFDRNTFDEIYLMSLIKRLKIEAAAQSAKVSSDINQIADEIDKNWWLKNGDDFLKDVKR